MVAMTTGYSVRDKEGGDKKNYYQAGAWAEPQATSGSATIGQQTA